MNKKYQYSHSQTINTSITDASGNVQDISLHEGGVYTLPSNNAYIRTLVSKGYLHELPVDEAAPTEPAKPNGDKK